ncbi:DNA-binding protein [Terasakiella sp.]|uniref:DNA-binding protein n=1 Tax=Terasakiella sp. TaxID=2034861 RepID=UPI003AA967DB
MSDNQVLPANFVRRDEAARYITKTWGFPCSRQWLAKLATTGGGPVFYKAGKYPIYALKDLDEWAQSRLSKPMRATGIPVGGKD